MQAALDCPSTTDICDPLTLCVRGWVHAGSEPAPVAIEAVANGTLSLGRTTLFYPRADVSAALGLPVDTPTGFTLLGTATTLVAEKTLALAVVAHFADGRRETILNREVTLTGRDYRTGDWGILIDPAFPHLVRQEHMYHSGPPLDAPSTDLLTLLNRYLPRPSARVLDIGCGRGPYGPPLIAAGYQWMGVEIRAEDCATMAERGLPHRQVDGTRLPFADGEFDAAICIEVLEHTTDPWSFIAEARRVTRGRLLISVPNLELVPYLRPYLAVPWHLLESDHRNFFSRASLRELLRPHFRTVEIQSYGETPLRTREGARLDYHLFAVAEV